MKESKLTLTLLEGEEKIYIDDVRNVVETGYGDYLIEVKNMKKQISSTDIRLVAVSLDKLGGQMPKRIEVIYEY